MGSAAEGHGGARRYRSPQRQQRARQTRARILAAARDGFLAAGYAGTTMRAVAAAAGVSLPTVLIAFGTKSRLLAEVIDVAIAGDDEPVPVLARGPAADAAAATGVREFLEAVAAILAEAQQRSARLNAVLVEAAAADSALRPVAERRLADRARTAEWIADGVLARGIPRRGVDRRHAVDTVWLLMEPVLHGRLTGDTSTGNRGWSQEDYRTWFADSVVRLLLDGEDGPRVSRGGAGAPPGPEPSPPRSRARPPR